MASLNHIPANKTRILDSFTLENFSRSRRRFENICVQKHRTVVKLVEVVICAATVALVANARPVWSEKDVIIGVCTAALFGSFAFLIIYIFALDELIPSTSWFIVETTWCTMVAIGLFSCTLVLLLVTTSYWAEVNPIWHAMSAFAAGSTFICSLLHAIDVSLLVINWRRYSWNPSGEEYLRNRGIPL